MRAPHEVRAALRVLCNYAGDPMVDALYPHAMLRAMDPREMERLRRRRHIFLARFGRQSVLQWADVESREVKRYVLDLADFLVEENEAARRAMRDDSPGG